jgi:hypothetical protein
VSYLLGLLLEGDAIGPLKALAGWLRAMDARFYGIRGSVWLRLVHTFISYSTQL